MAPSRVRPSKGEEQWAHIADVERDLQHTVNVIDLTKLEVARSNRLLDTPAQPETSKKPVPKQ